MPAKDSLFIFKLMPPKKKANKVADEPGPADQPKPADKPEPFPEPKKEEPKPEPKPLPVQTPLARLEQSLPQEPPAAEQKPTKIAIDDAAKMSEEEKLKLRRLRFGVLGTETTAEEAERIKQERLKKFGGPAQEDNETIEKRRQKFGNAPAATEDPEIVKRRLEKFGGAGTGAPGAEGAVGSEEKALLEERRKKFGNPEATVTLEEEIKKNKPIKKFHPKFNTQPHRGQGHHARR